MSKERPIIFSAPMVRAILEGRKTQTRRTLRLEKINSNLSAHLLEPPRGDIDHSPHWPRFPYPKWHAIFERGDDRPAIGIKCPYGKPGERLWVRESAIIAPKNWNNGDDHNCRDAEGYPRLVQYLATERSREGADQYKLKASPSIFMPRWASRILLEITDIRVERLQDISEEDAKAEGAQRFLPCVAFANYWIKINGYDSWNSNPWVWVISFRRIQPCQY